MRTAYPHTDPLLFKESLMGSDCFVTGQVGLSADIRSHGGFFMNYKKNYDDYVAWVKTQNRYKMHPLTSGYKYYERHHIIPKCMGGSDYYDNIVLLEAREHYLAHYLLTKIYPSNHKILNAFFLMNPMRPSGYAGYFNSKIYEVCRIKLVEACSGSGNPMFGIPSPMLGKHQSDEVKKYLSDLFRGRACPWMSDYKHSEEAKKKISIVHKGKFVSEETVLKLRESCVNSKMVSCIETGEVFTSVCEASRVYHICRSSISRCALGQYKTSGGFHWRYV